MKVKLPYLSDERDGLYVRRYGKRVRIKELLGSPAFLVAYSKALDELGGTRKERTIPELQPWAAETLGWLATKYFASIEFLKLNPQSQVTRRDVIEACLREPLSEDNAKPMGECPLDKLSAKKVRRLRDLKAKLPGAANNRRKYLSAMFGWGVEADLLEHNPARDVKRIAVATDGFHTWTVEEVEQYRAHHAIGTKARLALELLLLTGVRRGDLVTLGRQHVKNGVLRFVPRKTSYKRKVASEKPLLPALAAVIEQSPCGDLTYLVTEYGKPFTAAGFGNWFRDRCNEAGLPGCTAHGLRKAGACMAAMNGATAPQLMALFDWSTLAIAQKYIEEANRKKMTAQAMPLLEKAIGDGDV